MISEQELTVGSGIYRRINCDLCHSVLCFNITELDPDLMNLQITPAKAINWIHGVAIGHELFVKEPASCFMYLRNNLCPCGDYHEVCLECEQQNSGLYSCNICPFLVQFVLLLRLDCDDVVCCSCCGPVSADDDDDDDDENDDDGDGDYDEHDDRRRWHACAAL